MGGLFYPHYINCHLFIILCHNLPSFALEQLGPGHPDQPSDLAVSSGRDGRVAFRCSSLCFSCSCGIHPKPRFGPALGEGFITILSPSSITMYNGDGFLMFLVGLTWAHYTTIHYPSFSCSQMRRCGRTNAMGRGRTFSLSSHLLSSLSLSTLLHPCKWGSFASL